MDLCAKQRSHSQFVQYQLRNLCICETPSASSANSPSAHLDLPAGFQVSFYSCERGSPRDAVLRQLFASPGKPMVIERFPAGPLAREFPFHHAAYGPMKNPCKCFTRTLRFGALPVSRRPAHAAAKTSNAEPPEIPEQPTCSTPETSIPKIRQRSFPKTKSI